MSLIVFMVKRCQSFKVLLCLGNLEKHGNKADISVSEVVDWDILR